MPEERADKITKACEGLASKAKCTIRELAQVIGQLVAAFPAVEWGPLYYRQLEREKTKALKHSKGSFEDTMTLSQEGKIELVWWIENIHTACFKLEKPTLELVTDASTSGGWGAVVNSQKTGGRTPEEQKHHINILELMTIEYGLKSFEEQVKNRHVKVLSDNTVAVAYVKNMGGSQSEESNAVAKRIWIWCKDRKVWQGSKFPPVRLPGTSRFSVGQPKTLSPLALWASRF